MQYYVCVVNSEETVKLEVKITYLFAQQCILQTSVEQTKRPTQLQVKH
jgi:hypothetical protein